MRTLCLLLILANVLYAAWSQLIDVRASSLDRKPATQTRPPARIVLARESEQAHAQEPALGPIQDVQPPAVEPLHDTAVERKLAATQPDDLTCTTVGPFANLSQAAQAQAALRSAGFQPRQRLVQGEIWAGYWVSVQGLPNREAVEDAIRKLNANGVSDVYLMPGGDPQNVLSLGVFSDYQRAQRRVEEVRALGLTPRLDDRTRASAVYWIDVELQEPGQTIDSSLFQSDQGKITRLEMRACPASGAG